MKEIEAIKAALAAGPTPGPWIGAGPSHGKPLPEYLNSVVYDGEDGDENDWGDICNDTTHEDAVFIAACNPAAMAAVLAHIEEQAKEISIRHEGNTMNQAPIVDFTIDIARSVADQCICHPASRSVDDIERAGEAIKYLLWVIEKTRATAAVELDRAQRGEPVAWLYEGKYSGGGYSPNYFEWRVTLNKAEAQTARRLKPLYTAPQPERKHTEAEVQELLNMSPYQSDETPEEKVRRILGAQKP